MKQVIEVKAVARVFVQDATGVNPDGKRYEVIDEDGDRLVYVDSIQGAKDEASALTDGLFGFDVTVTEVTS